MNYQAPSVIRKHGGRMAIVTTKGRKLYDVVEMSDKALLVKKFSCEELQAIGYVHDPYPVVRAAEKFLTHTAGLSPNARTALEEVVDNSWLL